MMRKLKYVLIALFVSSTASAQLFHFSQFDNTPIFLNPAATGLIDGKYRLTTAYKNQWGSVSSPYNSFFGAAETRFAIGENTGSYVGAGISIISDKAGTTNYGILGISGSGSYILQMSSNQGISFGLSIGYLQQSVNLSEVKWDSQYDGANYDPAVNSGEPAYNPNRNYIDLGGGVTYLIQPYRRLKFETGLAFKHINQPKRSFMNAKDFNEGMRYNITAKSEIGLIKAWVPMVMASFQGGAYDVLFGGLRKITVGESSRYTNAKTASAIYFGALYRWKDAGIVQVMYDHKQMFRIGVSYDVNISRLSVASRRRGGFELTLVYFGRSNDMINVNKLKQIDNNMN